LLNEKELLDLALNKRVLFMGEPIIDRYTYVKPLGRPTKDAILSVEYVSHEDFEGGVHAAAKHAKQFCRNVDVLTGGDVYRKERFVEPSHMHKIFQTYTKLSSGGGPINYKPEDYDAVCLLDYGHSFYDNMQGLNEFTFDTKFFSVNCQTNSGNYGFNRVSKYPTSFAEYLCVDESEAMLHVGFRGASLEDCLCDLRRYATKVVITLGKKGAIGREAGKIFRCEAFADQVTDTMGSGDAFFAITSLIAKEADMQSLLRIGNAAGALQANITGNKQPITKEALLELLSKHSI